MTGRSPYYRLCDFLIGVAILIYSVACILPFWLMIAGSITEESEILKLGYRFIPEHLSTSAYNMIFTGNRVLRSYIVTIEVASLGTGISMTVTVMFAWAVSLKRVKYANHVAFFVFFTMLFNGGMVPWYIVMTQYLRLGNSIWAMILPYTVHAWFMFLMRNFFRGIPDSIMESAKLDGAHELRILFQIILPLSLPAIATIGLFYSLLYWNDWYLALMLIDRNDMFPLQFLLRALASNLMNVANSLNPSMSVKENPPAYSVRMATVVVTIGPIIFLYPFIQRYFVRGIIVGAVKG